MKTEICDAIKNKNLIEFYYDGCWRIVEPHTFGVNKKGNEVLSAFQVDGKSNSINIPDWGLFKISKLSSLKVLSTTFSGPRSEYNPNSDRMSKIYCEL